LALAAKAHATYSTAARLLDLYVGHSCGSQVLDGRILRGEGERISCGIWFCDLRDSSRLVSELSLEDYIDLLNRYFEVTIGAVVRSGGEVLKLIGDAVMGIFRSDHRGDDLAMREQALAASSATLDEVRNLSGAGRALRVGIGLHVGEVMFGNVGSDERMDFTVIGRAVNEAARLQALTKSLKQPVLASASFAEPLGERFEFMGEHAVAGFGERLAIYAPRP
jgi:adenylate cyclase